jgi:hypothetical protein
VTVYADVWLRHATQHGLLLKICLAVINIINYNINAMTAPPSLRDLYNYPSSAWSFLPAPTPSSDTTSPAHSQVVSPTYQYQWSTRPSYNSIFDLSPSIDLNERSSLNATLLFRSLLASAVLQYTSSAIAMPWEVGKLLLQVQWVPRDTGNPGPNTDLEEEDDAVSDTVH